MINPQELRIGNTVQFAEDGTVFYVTNTDDLGAGLKNDEEITWIEASQLEGVPLTEEWLLKLGFTKEVNEDDFDYWIHKKIGREIWQHDKGFCHNYGFGGDINSVHQLQNLCFAVTGEELSIKD